MTVERSRKNKDKSKKPKGKASAKGKKPKATKPKLTAATADKFVLYQDSVQAPEAEVEFFEKLYKKQYGEKPTLFREDFCGTSLISCEWAKRNKANRAYGVDPHQPTLDWGRRNNLSRLNPEQRERVHLIRDDVRSVREPKVQVVGAFNFSYFIFKELGDLVAYFRGARESLLPRGMFICDAYGGYEAEQVMEEKTKHKGFSYIWDQAVYNPIDDHAVCHIHFRFPDGTEMKRAFSYDWRLWTLGGVRDAMKLAGFSETRVYWEGEDEDGDGNGIYRYQTKAENTPGWNAYILALP